MTIDTTQEADLITAKLDEIRQREQAATPGPWGWYGNTDVQSIYLATKRWGRFTVMHFRRWGMQAARPMFAVGRTWNPDPQSDLDFGVNGRMAAPEPISAGDLEDADSMPVFEVAPQAEKRSDKRVYRADIVGIRNPDAEFIASSRDDVARLLRVVNAVYALCRDTDGSWLEPSSSLPVGEFQAALALIGDEDQA